MVVIPNPQSIKYPNTRGPNALANTDPAWSNALTVPKLFTPYISAHNDPMNGALIPILRPYKHMYAIKKNILSNKRSIITDNNRGTKTVIAVFLVLNLSMIGPPIKRPIIEKKPNKI